MFARFLFWKIEQDFERATFRLRLTFFEFPQKSISWKFQECNDDERNCAAKGDKFIYSTNAVCKTFAPFPSPASSINTNTGLSVNSITAITTEPLGSTVDFSATPPPSVVTEECKTILQQKDAILMINLINPVEWDMVRVLSVYELNGNSKANLPSANWYDFMYQSQC